MNRRIWVLAVVVAAACGAGRAADKPDFSGKWVINNAKSEFGPMPQGPDRFERKVDHQDPQIKVTTIQAMQGNERTTEVAYVIDGNEHDVQIGETTAKVTANWMGPILEVITKRDIQGNTITSIEKWSLSSDRKTLTLNSEITTPQGEFKLKFVLDKQ